MQNSSKIGLETKKLKKWEMSFLKIAQQFFVYEYFLLIPIDVPSSKSIEGQIKELPEVVPTPPPPPPPAENDQKSPGMIGLTNFTAMV